MSTQSSPSNVRSNLKAIIKNTDQLRDLVFNLDSNSKILLEESRCPSPKQTLTDELTQMSNLFNSALSKANTLPKGNTKDYSRRLLVTQLAISIKNHLNVQPTQSKKRPIF